MLVFLFTCLCERADYHLLHREQVLLSVPGRSVTEGLQAKGSCPCLWHLERQGGMLNPAHLVQRLCHPCQWHFGELRAGSVQILLLGEGWRGDIGAAAKNGCENSRTRDGEEKGVFAAHDERTVGC